MPKKINKEIEIRQIRSEYIVGVTATGEKLAFSLIAFAGDPPVNYPEDLNVGDKVKVTATEQGFDAPYPVYSFDYELDRLNGLPETILIHVKQIVKISRQ